MSKTYLIDNETQKGAVGAWTSEGTVAHGGKTLLCVPAAERDKEKELYSIILKGCGLKFLTGEKLDDFPFYPVPMLALFAVDGLGYAYGTVGGAGSMAPGDDAYSVAYVRRGECGFIAGGFRQFMSIALCCPGWRTIAGMEELSHGSEDRECARAAANRLGLYKLDGAPGIIKRNASKKGLHIYASYEDALLKAGYSRPVPGLL